MKKLKAITIAVAAVGVMSCASVMATSVKVQVYDYTWKVDTVTDSSGKERWQCYRHLSTINEDQQWNWSKPQKPNLPCIGYAKSSWATNTDETPPGFNGYCASINPAGDIEEMHAGDQKLGVAEGPAFDTQEEAINYCKGNWIAGQPGYNFGSCKSADAQAPYAITCQTWVNFMGGGLEKYKHNYGSIQLVGDTPDQMYANISGGGTCDNPDQSSHNCPLKKQHNACLDNVEGVAPSTNCVQTAIWGGAGVASQRVPINCSSGECKIYLKTMTNSSPNHDL
jgi:hypothetical protein